MQCLVRNNERNEAGQMRLSLGVLLVCVVAGVTACGTASITHVNRPPVTTGANVGTSAGSVPASLRRVAPCLKMSGIEVIGREHGQSGFSSGRESLRRAGAPVTHREYDGALAKCRESDHGYRRSSSRK